MASGVPAAQLHTTYKGRGGKLSVEFLPKSAVAAPAGEDKPLEELERMPLPAGIPFQLRHRASDQVIVGPLRTEVGGLEVACPLPASAALFVAHDYVVEALAGPGTEPNAAAFHMPADLTDEDTLEVKLPIRLTLTLISHRSVTSDTARRLMGSLTSSVSSSVRSAGMWKAAAFGSVPGPASASTT